MAAMKCVKHQREKWLDENMVAAKQAVEKKELTIAAAAYCCSNMLQVQGATQDFSGPS